MPLRNKKRAEKLSGNRQSVALNKRHISTLFIQNRGNHVNAEIIYLILN